MKKSIRRCLIALLLVSMLGSLTACGSKTNVPELLEPIETEDAVYTVKRGDLTSTTILTGTVVPEMVHMKLDYSNDAYDIAFKEGDTVKEGDIVLKLNDSLERSITEAELNLTVTETKYNVEKAAFEKSIAEMNKRYNSLVNSGDSYNASLLKLEIAQAELEFDFNHIQAEMEMEEIKQELEAMRVQAAESLVKAPCDGTIVFLSVEEDGDTIDAKKTFLSIAKDGSKRLSCPYISEEDVELFYDLKANVAGKEYSISYIPFTEEELFYLELQSGAKYCYFTMDQMDEVKYGDNVIYTFSAAVKQVLHVPTQAIYSSHGTYYVDVIKEDKKREPRVITIGKSNLNNTEVTDGLTEGEVIYVAKDIARYSVKYETTNAYLGDIDRSGTLNGVTREAKKLGDFVNPVPGTIEEIFVTITPQMFVTKGQELYSITPSISDAEWQETKVDLKNFQKEYDEKCTSYEEMITEKKKEINAISNALEKKLANFELDDIKKEYEEYQETGTERIEQLTERIANFEEWSKGTVTVCAEEDGIIQSFASLKVGGTLRENEVICDFLSPNEFVFSYADDKNMLRYGMEIQFQSRPERDLVTFDAKVTKSPLVMSVDGWGNRIEASLSEGADYTKTAATGYFLINNQSVRNVLLLPNKVIQYAEQEEENDKVEIVPLNSDKKDVVEGKPFVFVYDENHCIVKRYISIVELNDGIAWVSDGITKDDVIVIP